MEVKRSEDSLIFYALTPKITKMSRVFDAIAGFMRNKQAKDPSDRFNLILFQENGPSYLEDFSFDPDYILRTLKSLARKIVKANIASGIFIAISFIIDVFKRISDKVFRLIILTDDGAREIPAHYIPILIDLIEKVKELPFFIDIIRINSKYPLEGKKLMKLAKRSNGNLYDIVKIRELTPLLITLSEKKYIKIPTMLMQKKKVILNGNKQFFVNFADKPLVVETIEPCAICFQRDDKGIVRCPSCDTTAHATCWAQWAETSNIGMPHVFRCHNCFNILTLDKNFVIDVQAGRISTAEQVREVSKRDALKYLQELEAKEKPKIIQVEDPLSIKTKTTDVEAGKAKTSEGRRKRRGVKVVICPNCSKITTNFKMSCPNCGFLLRAFSY